MIDDAYRAKIRETAAALGVSPTDLATVISYETAGTFDPTKAGPKTKWGRHRGLIQFGEPQAKKYGVDWSRPIESQLGENGAVVRYFKDRGFKKGGSLLDLYSTVNAGSPGLYDRTDQNAGGAPGTVREKVEGQFAPHRKKALEVLGVADLQFDPEKFESFKASGAAPPARQPATSTGFDPEKFDALRAAAMGSGGQPPVQEQPAGDPPSRLEAFGRGAVQGATLGFGDELYGASKKPTIDQGYALALEAMENGATREEASEIARRFIEEGRNAATGQARSANQSAEDAHSGAYLGGQIAGGIASGVAAAATAPVAAPATVLGRGALAAGGGASMGGAIAVGEGDGKAGLGDIAIGATAGAVGGLLGVPLQWIIGKSANFLGQRVSRILSKPGAIDEASGAISETARRAMLEAGVDPEMASRQLAQAWEAEGQKAIAGGGDPARAALAAEFGIPLTKGQMTGRVPDIANEEAMRAGTRGQAAYDVMDGFGRRQAATITNARNSLADEVAPAGNVDAIEAAEMAQTGIQRAAKEAKDAGSAAYQAFEEMGGGIRGVAAQGFFNRIARRFDREDIVPEAGMTNTASGLKIVNRMLEGAESGSIPFKRLEATRQRLNQAVRAAERGSDSADAYAIKALRSEYDDWLDESVINAISDGTPEAMRKVREARKLWGSYARTYLGKKGADNTIRKIVEDELSPDQVMGWLIGTSKNVGGGQTATVMKKVREVLGADSPEFLALKRATFDRLTMNAGQMRGVDDIASNLAQFTSGKGKALASQIFTPDELARIGEFQRALAVLKKPAKATNPSGSGYAAERGAQALWQGLAGALGFATGGAGGAVGGAIAIKGGANFVSGMRAKAATAGIRGPAPSIAAGMSGGATGGAALERSITD